MKNLLFITHDISRTGAPHVLLYFIKWLRVNYSDIKISVLSLKDGELREDFKKVSDEFYDLTSLEGNDFSNNKYLGRFFLKKSGNKQVEKLLDELSARGFDLIYANSIVSIPIADRIFQKSKSSKFVAHIHELETIIRLKLPGLNKYQSRIDLFIAASDLVKQNLKFSHGIPEAKIKTIYEFSDSKPIKRQVQKSEFEVLGMGTVHWRKGSDIFIQVAAYIKRKFPRHKIKFCWIGAFSKIEGTILEMDLKKLGLEEMVEFIGEKENPANFYADSNLFLLTSREDPFPLAAIELGMAGKPVICFEGATGIQEVVKNGGGRIVPYLDIQAMAHSIIEYYENEELLSKHSKEATELFSEYSPDIICPKLFASLKRI